MNANPPAVPARSAAPRRGRYLGPVKITLPLIVVLLTLIGSLVFDAYVVAAVSDGQIPLVAVGLAVTGASFAALAIGAVAGMWRAASRLAGGRSFALALVGGLSALAAIGCFAITAVLLLLTNS
ncbi:MAG: hypothetical protein ABI620_09130 [Chloroflexota bacterium]